MNTKLRKTNLWLAILLSLAVPLVVYSYVDGPPVGYTGAADESDCTDCHIGTRLNGGPGRVVIILPESYSSGVTYPLTVTVFDPNQRRWGFELSARTGDRVQAGAFHLGADGFTRLTAAFRGLVYIEHTFTGTRLGARDTGSGVSFNFTWTAPDVSAGAVVFNVAANAANGDTSSSGDLIYSTEATLQPAGSQPSVFEGGTVNNASFAAGTTPLAPGSIAAIFGTGLNDGSGISDSSFGSDGKLLSTLGGASVTFNDIPAPIFSSFQSQLNVQVPFELTGSSTASVRVTSGGQTSSPRTVPLGPSSPGIFAVNNQGTGQGAIQIANTVIFAAPENSIPGVEARPANRGDFLTIFCTGLGDVTNRPASGVAASGNPLSTTTATPQVTIGGIPATVNFAGLSPGFVGLYQVNAEVPAGAPSGGSVQVKLSIGGVESNMVTIAVGP